MGKQAYKLEDSEKWVKSYEGIYFATTDGDVFKLSDDGDVKKMAVFERRGNAAVSLSKDGKQREVRVDRMMWETFIGEVPKGQVVSCKIKNIGNDRLSNLELKTRMQLNELKKNIKQNKEDSKMKKENFDLSEITGGNVQRKINAGVDKIIDNIQDQNVNPEKKNELLIRVTFTSDEFREIIDFDADVTTKFAPQESSYNSQIQVTRDKGTGRRRLNEIFSGTPG